MLKKTLCLLITMISVNFAFADSCIMISPVNILKIECPNNKVLSFNILSTLMNEKKSVVVSSLKDGEVTFSLKLKNKTCSYKAVVSGGKLNIKGDNYIKILPIDVPPELVNSGEVN